MTHSTTPPTLVLTESRIQVEVGTEHTLTIELKEQGGSAQGNDEPSLADSSEVEALRAIALYAVLRVADTANQESPTTDPKAAKPSVYAPNAPPFSPPDEARVASETAMDPDDGKPEWEKGAGASLDLGKLYGKKKKTKKRKAMAALAPTEAPGSQPVRSRAAPRATAQRAGDSSALGITAPNATDALGTENAVRHMVAMLRHARMLRVVGDVVCARGCQLVEVRTCGAVYACVDLLWHPSRGQHAAASLGSLVLMAGRCHDVYMCQRAGRVRSRRRCGHRRSQSSGLLR